jgi:hypothetical protein
MSSRLRLLLLLFAALPLSAQTIYDVGQQMNNVSQDVRHALAEVKQEADVLNTVSHAAQSLDEMQPATSLDKGVEIIDDFIRKTERMGPPLSKEMLRLLNLARQPIDDAKKSPGSADLKKLREQLHHEVVHQLQVKMGNNARQLDTLMQQNQQMMNQMHVALMITTMATSDAAR